MRSLVFSAVTAFSVVSVACPAAHAGTQSGHYSVELNKTEVVYLPQAAGAVVIGNPDIADVSIHSSDTIFVVGRGFGETNLIVLNAAGQTIMNANVQVTNTLPSHGVHLFNGSDRQTYSCAPYCQPAPVLGDEIDFISENSGERSEINNTASTAAPRRSFTSAPRPSGGPPPPTASGPEF